MNKKTFILSLAAIAVMTINNSCKRNADLNPGQAGAVHFTSSVGYAVSTKVTGNSWDANDSIGVFVKKSADGTVIDANKAYSTSGNGNFAPSGSNNTINYPADGSSINFVAYYPYTTSLSGNTYKVDVTSQANPALIDLLYADNATNFNKTSTSQPNLNFTHQLSKVELTVKAGAGVNTSGLGVELRALDTKADFDLNTGVLAASTAPALAINANVQVSGSDKLASAILLPASTGGKMVVFKLANGDNYSWTIPTGTIFEKGKKYNYTVTLNSGTSTAALGATTITNWTDAPAGGTVNLNAPPAANGQPVSVTINQTQPGYTIANNFMGLSYETKFINIDPAFLNASNTVLIQMINNLGGGVLRIGGSSSDGSIWAGKARGNGVNQDSLYTTDVDRLDAFAKAVNWPVIFGLNIKTYNPSLAAREAQYVANKLGNSLYALQFGNEPNLFGELRSPGVTYDYNQFLSEWLVYRDSVRARVPNVPLAGPDISAHQAKQWCVDMANSQASNLKAITGHFYHAGPASDPSITYEKILSRSDIAVTYPTTLNTAAAANNLVYRMTECGSLFGGGKTGVSDVFASALWTLDFMWLMARNNCEGVNFHGSSGSAYTPIAKTNGVMVPRPGYYAMLAFKYAGTVGGRILPVTLSANNRNCTAYACLNNDGKTYVTLINKDPENISYTLNLSSTVSTMKLARLTAPSVTATGGVTFSGSSVQSDGSFTPGTPEQYNVGSSSVVVNVPARTAVVVTLQ